MGKKAIFNLSLPPPHIPIPSPIMFPVSSRRSGDNPVFGFPCELPSNSLPTHFDVLQRLLLSKGNVTDSETAKTPLKDFVDPVAEEVMEVWKKASLPTVSLKRIKLQVTEIYQCARLCLRRSVVYEGKDKLFDICACKCLQVDCAQVCCKEDDCEEIHILHSKKIPHICKIQIDPKELPFLMDQRGKRAMFIGGIHQKDSLVLQK